MSDDLSEMPRAVIPTPTDDLPLRKLPFLLLLRRYLAKVIER